MAEAAPQPSRSLPVRPPEPVIAAHAEFEGLLQLREPARIDGAVTGEVISSASLWIGETGHVRARVEAPKVLVAGALEGEIWASEKIELRKTARVSGSLHAPAVVFADGSFFEGACSTGVGETQPETGVRPAISGAETA